MALEAYRRKRDFTKTPEPAGPRKSSSTQRMFVVQKHAATQLHYDFRLELDGVMLSWAVPKGPSLDPAEKRLAVQVEDHPIAYGAFEGIIPEGEYGGGTVLLWDRGQWSPLSHPHESLRKGTLKFVLSGQKLWGGYTLVRIKKEGEGTKNWLLIKERDDAARPEESFRIIDEEPFSVDSSRSMSEIASARDWVWNSKAKQTRSVSVKQLWRRGVYRNLNLEVSKLPGAKKAKLPKKIKAVTPKSVKTIPAGKEWLHEILHEGETVVCHLTDETVVLHSTAGEDWTPALPEIVRAVGRLPVESAVLVGTIASRIPGADTSAVGDAVKRRDATWLDYVLFDLPCCAGFDLRSVTLERRKALLARLLDGVSDPIRLAEHMEGRGALIRREAERLGALGMVSRRARSKYPSKITSDWVVVRFPKTEESKTGKRRVAATSVQTETRIADVRFTTPQRVLYPEERVTKKMLAEYYEVVAKHMLPFVARRPLSLYRCPAGIEKECFFQKQLGDMSDEHVHHARGKEDPYIWIENVQGILTLVQWNVLELHIWGSLAKALSKPDQMVFDLDPGPQAPWELLVEGAKGLRWLLQEMKLQSFIKTSGGKGMHVVVPLVPRHTWDEVKDVSAQLARKVANAAPKYFTAVMSKEQRKGKVFIDYFRNSRGSTTIAPYSTRARPGANVSTPLSWEEIEGTRPQFNIVCVLDRLAVTKDPWQDFFSVRNQISAGK